MWRRARERLVKDCLDRVLRGLPALLAASAFVSYAAAESADPRLFTQYCIACHNSQTKTADLALDTVLAGDVESHADVWEEVVRRLRTRQMPPAGMPRPPEADYDAAITSVGGALDRAAAANPNPGRTDTFRRLNRTEYRNTIRDLLAVDIDVSSLLPGDESSRGFDNITVGDLSPTLLDRYVNAAEKISRLAVGLTGKSPGGDVIRIPPDLTQEEHFDGLPMGTRGGALIPYTFPVDGEYEISVRLARDRNERIEGLNVAETHQIDILVDRKPVQSLTLKRPRTTTGHATADFALKARVPIKAGPHMIGATFPRKSGALLETVRQPYQAHFNYYRHPRVYPAIYSLSIIGPYTVDGPGNSPSRQRIFVCRPDAENQQEACAKRIITNLMRRAYRRPVNEVDIARPFEFYKQTRETAAFDAGIELALSAILVSPEFLFRVEQDPPGIAPKTAYRVSDLELASRLSFFLWSSLPDEELLEAATKGELRKPDVLESQVRRMLANDRSSNLVDNFAAQWLYLRNLEAIRPDMRLFPDFDDNLRQAFRKETELLFEHVLRADRSILELLDANYTFLDERLAKHYRIPGVYGARFRRVELDDSSKRGGLLRHGSVLTVSSYAHRTSPVLRGKWVLENILGIPPPPPPPNVPVLKDKTDSGSLTVRERLAEHRADPACAGCHNLIDPVGFALENYDAVGRWRTSEAGQPIDSKGRLPDGSEFDGVAGLEQAVLRRPDVFTTTLAEKLLTFAIGRGVESYDGPAIRAIVNEAREADYRFSSLILGVAKSVPFQMRRSR